jgi:hypothetical protein
VVHSRLARWPAPNRPRDSTSVPLLERVPRFRVNAVCERLLGPLAGPECRRAVRGGSVLVARSLAVLPACLILLGVAWACWLYPRVDPTFSTAGMLRIGLVAVEGLLITASLILGPAVLAGALAGDRARGMLALLQIGQVSNWEIVAGRLAGPNLPCRRLVARQLARLGGPRIRMGARRCGAGGFDGVARFNRRWWRRSCACFLGHGPARP